MLRQILRFSFLIIFSTVISFCSNKKKVIYFQGNLPSEVKNNNIIFRPDDILSIKVVGVDADAAKPFNLPVISDQQTGGYSSGIPSPPGYVIDQDGNIDLPVLGKVKVAGLTKIQCVEFLKEQLKPYLNKPTIIVKLVNYKITVLGEVKNPGTFTIPNERITLVEALGVAGDLTISGIRKNILVIRESEGKRTETRVDLTSKELFNSPVFYLQQNDIVYVEPNRTRINSAQFNTGYASIAISGVSLLVTLILLFKK
jgi:polysaccharide export outer membrane protein